MDDGGIWGIKVRDTVISFYFFGTCHLVMFSLDFFFCFVVF